MIKVAKTQFIQTYIQHNLTGQWPEKQLLYNFCIQCVTKHLRLIREIRDKIKELPNKTALDI